MKQGGAFRKSMVVAVLSAISLPLLSSNAIADSARSWGYWDVAPAAGNTGQVDTNYSRLANSAPTTDAGDNQTGEEINTTQNITGLARGSVNSANGTQKSIAAEIVSPVVYVPEIGHADYVAYLECVSDCYGDNRTIGLVGLTAEGFNYVGTSDPIVGRDSVRQITTYQTKMTGQGAYDGMLFYLSDDAASIRHDETSFLNGQYIERLIIDAASGGNSMTAMSDGFSDATGIASINTESGFGKAVWGKPIVASEIESQMRLGQSYRFSGSSVHASVEITVDFQNASWDGAWITTSGAAHNGFTAGGDITGSTLISDQLTGAGQVGAVGYVNGGKVHATLTGVIHGTDASKAAVIGQSSINVQQVVGTKQLLTNFTAHGVKR